MAHEPRFEVATNELSPTQARLTWLAWALSLLATGGPLLAISVALWRGTGPSELDGWAGFTVWMIWSSITVFGLLALLIVWMKFWVEHGELNGYEALPEPGALRLRPKDSSRRGPKERLLEATSIASAHVEPSRPGSGAVAVIELHSGERFRIRCDDAGAAEGERLRGLLESLNAGPARLAARFRLWRASQNLARWLHLLLLAAVCGSPALAAALALGVGWWPALGCWALAGLVQLGLDPPRLHDRLARKSLWIGLDGLHIEGHSPRLLPWKQISSVSAPIKRKGFTNFAPLSIELVGGGSIQLGLYTEMDESEPATQGTFKALFDRATEARALGEQGELAEAIEAPLPPGGTASEWLAALRQVADRHDAAYRGEGPSDEVLAQMVRGASTTLAGRVGAAVVQSERQGEAGRAAAAQAAAALACPRARSALLLVARGHSERALAGVLAGR